MTTTLASLQAGSSAVKFVVAIGGYRHLLSDASQSAVQTAWAGTDWAANSVIGGLVVELDQVGQLHPWEPIQSGGTCTLKIQPDAADTFGIDIHKQDAGAESALFQTLDNNDNAAWVLKADDFTSGLSEAHVGTECFTYVSKGSLSLHLGNTTQSIFVHGNRGMYSPFGAYGSTRFGEYHRVHTADNGVRIEPIVSQLPRAWIGRRVGVWMHIADGSGNLNTKADALCVFAGRITEVRDDAATGHTHVLVEHVMDEIARDVCGADMFEAELANGLKVVAGQEFNFREWDGTTFRNANPLTIVSSGSTQSSTNQIDEGIYSIEEYCAAFNAWLAGETAAGRISGNYTLQSPEDVAGSPRTVMHWYIPGTGSPSWYLTWPKPNWGAVLGQPGPVWNDSDTPNAGHAHPSDFEPGMAQIFSYDYTIVASYSCEIANTTGTFVDQYSTLPPSIKNILGTAAAGLPWGLFLLDGKTLLVGSFDDTTSQLKGVFVIGDLFAKQIADIDLTGPDHRVKLGDPPPRIKQIYAHVGTFAQVVQWFLLSTGTPGYNGPMDVLSAGQGVGVPYDLMQNLAADMNAMTDANDTLCVVIDKPTKFAELFAADLLLRRCHLVWKQGQLRFISWSTPCTPHVTFALGESTKAAPANVTSEHRTPWVLDSTWVKNIIKLNYDRDISKIGEIGSVQFVSDPITLEDATSVDEVGPVPKTIDCRNTYNVHAGISMGIRALATGLLSWLPYFSRPVRKVTRSIDMRYYEQLHPGAVVALTDPFLRDPTTGQRGVTARPGLVTRIRYTYGGPNAGDPSQVRGMSGEVDIVFLAVDRTAAYSPAARVDDTQSNAGYNAGTVTLTCYANEYSLSSDTADAARFIAGDKIKIVEMDPSDPTAPTMWRRTVQSQTGNTITLTSALSSPAWDSAKKYRVLYDDYASVQTSQTATSYQAGTNRTVAELAPPDQYGLQSGVAVGTVYDYSAIPELPANVAYGPNVGAPRDPAYDVSIVQLLENVMDHKSARCSPSLMVDPDDAGVLSTGQYKLLQCSPIFLGDGLIGSELERYLWVAPSVLVPVAISSPATVRVTLTAYLPTGGSITNVAIKSPFVQQSWSFDGNAVILDAKPLQLSPFNGFQWAYLLVEGTNRVQCYGLARCQEGYRVPT